MSSGGKAKAEPRRPALAPEPVKDAEPQAKASKPAVEPVAPTPTEKRPPMRMVQPTGRYHVLGPITYALRGDRRTANVGDTVILDAADALAFAGVVRPEEETLEE